MCHGYCCFSANSPDPDHVCHGYCCISANSPDPNHVCHGYVSTMYANAPYTNLQYMPSSLVENQDDLELDFKVFIFVILVVDALYLINPTDATLASLSVLKYSRWRPRWPSVRLLRPI